jgi:hypothetical protein
MNTLAFRSVRVSHPNHTIEFNWPVGKEIPRDIRTLTVNEFYLALQLVAKCIKDVKRDASGKVYDTPDEYKDKYDLLVSNFHQNMEVTSEEYIKLKGLKEAIVEVTEEIEKIKGLLQEKRPEPFVNHTEEVSREEQPQLQAEAILKKRGRPRKQSKE